MTDEWSAGSSGALCLASAGVSGLLRVSVWDPGASGGAPLSFHPAGDDWVAASGDVRIRLRLPAAHADDGSGHRRLRVSVSAARSVRVEFLFSPAVSSGNAFHIIPGVLFGDNNLAVAGPGHFPNLTDTNPAGISCSRSWRMRTDRASAPVAMAFLPGGGHVAVAVPLYLEQRDGFIRTGLIAELPGAVGVSIGYRNAPRTFVNKDLFGDPAETCLPPGSAVDFDLDLFMAAGTGRHAAFAIVRKLYPLYWHPPVSTLDSGTCIQAIADMVVNDSWDEEHQAFLAVQVKGLPGPPEYRKIGGRAIAWVGGCNVGYPLLEAGVRMDHPAWIRIARRGLDKIAASTNPANGLFFDAFDPDWNPTVNYWWSGISNRDRHSAYTNAEATCYLLRAALLMRERTGTLRTEWSVPALGALETMLRLQRRDGHFGYAYETARAAVADWDGFAGCWWVPAMCVAYDLTDDNRYLHAARQAMEFYADWVATLDVWGTPMDSWKGNDEEGVLAFIRGARLLHMATGDERYLGMLQLGADYEFLWRYLLNARPEAEPLKSAGWLSCGGSITSVSNPHIHPMGLLVTADLKYLFERTGDPHVASRLQDGVEWARHCLGLFPGKTGYGRFGWTGERYCPSDGLLIARYADGSPASTELGLNLWAASAMLEGLLGAVYPVTEVRRTSLNP